MDSVREHMARVVKEFAESSAANGTPLSGAGLNDEELSRTGGMLFAALMAKASQRGEKLKDVADALGCTYSYLSQLRTGVRKIQQISDEIVDGCANYLQWPRLAVLVVSGKIRADDLLEEPLRMPAMLDQALALVREDPMYGPWFPASLLKLDDAGKHFIVRLYEDATGLKLLPYEGDLRPDTLKYPESPSSKQAEQEPVGGASASSFLSVVPKQP